MMMRRVAKFAAIAIAIPVFLLGLGFALIESGEVIVLRELPDQGHDLIARLWVVDYDGDPWVGNKADPSKAKWVRRLQEDPRVELSRGAVTDCREAIALEDLQTTGREIYALYQAKYRVPLYGSRLLGLLVRVHAGCRRSGAIRGALPLGSVRDGSVIEIAVHMILMLGDSTGGPWDQASE